MVTMSVTLTPRQEQLLAYLEDFIARHGYAPSEREMAAALDLASKTSVRKLLEALRAADRLSLMPGKKRSLRLTTPPLRGNQPSFVLPVLGRVAAGKPIGPAHESDEVLSIDPTFFRIRPDYLLRVRGDSMRDDGILDGDLVAIQQTSVARPGQTVVARIDDEVTIKRLHMQAGVIRLLPRNSAHAPIDVPPDADFAIEGLFAGLLRSA